MPYAYGKDHDQKRMIELGSMAIAVGSELDQLRSRFIEACEAMTLAVWPADPTLPLDRKTMSATLQSLQAGLTDRLNSKWAEKARLKVEQVIPEQVRRARRTFFGRIAHLDDRTDQGRSICLPDDLLGALAQDEIIRLKADIATAAEDLLAEARKAAAEASATPRAVALAWLYRHVVERFGQPEFGQDPRFIAQLHLDKDCLRPVKKAYPELLTGFAGAIRPVLETGKPAQFTAFLTPVIAGGEAVELTVSLGRRGLLGILVPEVRALGRRPTPASLADLSGILGVRSLCLEIGPGEATIKAVLSRSEPVNSELVLKADRSIVQCRRKLDMALSKAALTPTEEILADRDKAQAALDKAIVRADTLHRRFAEALRTRTAVIGVDPGRRDAMATSVLRIDGGIEAGRALDLGGFTQNQMRTFLSSHALPEPDVVERLSLDNQRFLSLMTEIGQRIDGLSRALNARYRRIAKLKGRINGALKLPAGRRLPEALDALDLSRLTESEVRDVTVWHRALFLELAKTVRLKAERLAQWERIRSVKRSWFGMIANSLSVSALEHDAGVALEDGDWGIERKESTNYQGRTQNRIMAAVSPRKLLDVIRAKLDWSGVVWWNVVSWYTSKTDHRVGVVSTEQRPQGGKVFTALHDGLRLDADQHAGETIAATALMTPLDADGMILRDSILARAGVAKTAVKPKKKSAKKKIAKTKLLGETAPGFVPSFSF